MNFNTKNKTDNAVSGSADGNATGRADATAKGQADAYQTIKNHPEGWFYCYTDSISQQALTT
jgi:hypothetical protein